MVTKLNWNKAFCYHRLWGFCMRKMNPIETIDTECVYSYLFSVKHLSSRGSVFRQAFCISCRLSRVYTLHFKYLTVFQNLTEVYLSTQRVSKCLRDIQATNHDTPIWLISCCELAVQHLYALLRLRQLGEIHTQRIRKRE